MKKILTIMIFSLMFVCLGITPIVAIAEDTDTITTDIEVPTEPFTWQYLCLLYTSDAADE